MISITILRIEGSKLKLGIIAQIDLYQYQGDLKSEDAMEGQGHSLGLWIPKKKGLLIIKKSMPT